MTTAAPLSKPISYRTIKYPDAGEMREEFLETLCWKDGQFPPLDKPGWHRTKMSIKETGALYRMNITTFKLVRNSWTKLVRAEFEYRVDEYDDVDKTWLY